MSSVALARQGRNSGGAKPVFVDALGTRGRLMRVGVWLFVGLCSAYVALFIMAALGGPTISTARLPIRVPIVSALLPQAAEGGQDDTVTGGVGDEQPGVVQALGLPWQALPEASAPASGAGDSEVRPEGSQAGLNPAASSGSPTPASGGATVPGGPASSATTAATTSASTNASMGTATSASRSATTSAPATTSAAATTSASATTLASAPASISATTSASITTSASVTTSTTPAATPASTSPGKSGSAPGRLKKQLGP